MVGKKKNPKGRVEDPNMEFLNVVGGGQGEEIHNKLILDIAKILRANGYKKLNYAHIEGSVKKDEGIPLENDKGRCDISVALGPHLKMDLEVNMTKCQQNLKKASQSKSSEEM